MSSSRIDGRVALVTGSTRGIGWATARLLAESGATVVVNGHSSEEAVQERVEELRGLGAEASGVLADVADRGAVGEMFRHVHRAHRRLDILVNNAGVLEDALLGMIPDDAVERLLAVNTGGMIACLQGGARLMRRSGGGSIVNLGSIVGLAGNAGQVVYSATKAAVVGITRSAAKELAADGIRVNAVAPGFIDTDMVRSLPDEVFRERCDSIALGRIGTPDDVARAVLFFASDLGAYVTGQVLGVDGGMLI